MKSATAEENEAPVEIASAQGFRAWFSWANESGFESLGSSAYPALKYRASEAKIG